MITIHRLHSTTKFDSTSSRYISGWSNNTLSTTIPSTPAPMVTINSTPTRLGRIWSCLFSNNRSETNRVKNSCKPPVRMSELAIR
ncbi:hypothetical protein D3C84_488260 [compost metagenome]